MRWQGRWQVHRKWVIADRLSPEVKLSAPEAQQSFSELIERVSTSHERFIVEKDGQPVMAMLSMQEYVALMQEAEAHQHEKAEAEKAANRRWLYEAARAAGAEYERFGISEEQALEMLDEVRAELYREHYGDNK